MPRANRHFLSGYVWHITHRCHRKNFLLKFARDRRSYLRWLVEAKKRFGLSVLDYIVTSNHIHLLIKDTGSNVISNSIQLIAGRSAQDTISAKHATVHSGKTVIIPLRSRLTSTCTVALFTST
jgi:putative transposase